MQIKRLPVEQIELNTGQIDGLPANPRQWTRDDIDRIANSLRETPELFEMRPCIVFPHEGKYILLAGNLRFTGARQNGDKDVPCCVVKADTPVEKLKEIVLKDNGSFGNWDFDALANEWDDLPLTDWGVPAWKADEENEDMYVLTDGNSQQLVFLQFGKTKIAITDDELNALQAKYNEYTEKFGVQFGFANYLLNGND